MENTKTVTVQCPTCCIIEDVPAGGFYICANCTPETIQAALDLDTGEFDC